MDSSKEASALTDLPGQLLGSQLIVHEGHTEVGWVPQGSDAPNRVKSRPVEQLI